MSYLRGQSFEWTATFTSAAGTPVTPASVVFTATNPRNEKTLYTAPNAAIANPSTGVYILTITLTLAGPWRFDAVGTGMPARKHINVHPLWGDDATVPA